MDPETFLELLKQQHELSKTEKAEMLTRLDIQKSEFQQQLESQRTLFEQQLTMQTEALKTQSEMLNRG